MSAPHSSDCTRMLYFVEGWVRSFARLSTTRHIINLVCHHPATQDVSQRVHELFVISRSAAALILTLALVLAALPPLTRPSGRRPASSSSSLIRVVGSLAIDETGALLSLAPALTSPAESGGERATRCGDRTITIVTPMSVPSAVDRRCAHHHHQLHIVDKWYCHQSVALHPSRLKSFVWRSFLFCSFAGSLARTRPRPSHACALLLAVAASACCAVRLLTALLRRLVPRSSPPLAGGGGTRWVAVADAGAMTITTALARGLAFRGVSGSCPDSYACVPGS